jgi:O-acetyl-ADP-ribose deacetylase (regulator of RNase III)
MEDMAIQYKKGDLLKEPVQAIVNTVNTVGVMGKGIALQFKEKFPENFKAYKKACDAGEVQTGKMLITTQHKIGEPDIIVNFPTKQHWRQPSKLEYVEKGLDDLVEQIKKYQIKSIAIPPLGCGNGGLDWNIVKSLIEKKLSPVEDIDIIIFEPSEIAYKKKRNVKKSLKLTELRAFVLFAMHKYTELGYELSVLETQKIVYLLQRLGLDFKLDFQKHIYGPYADKLRHVLYDMEGHYLHGMKSKEARPFDELTIEKSQLANIESLIEKSSQKNKLDTLLNIIEGYQSPLGMELLATIDLLIKDDKSLLHDTEALIDKIHNWNERKARLMKPHYIKVTQERLRKFEDVLYA